MVGYLLVIAEFYKTSFKFFAEYEVFSAYFWRQYCDRNAGKPNAVLLLQLRL
jgi:hypothetical protein